MEEDDVKRPMTCGGCHDDLIKKYKCLLCRTSFCQQCFSMDNIIQQCYSCKQIHCLFCTTYMSFWKEGKTKQFQCPTCSYEMSKID